MFHATGRLGWVAYVQVGSWPCGLGIECGRRHGACGRRSRWEDRRPLCSEGGYRSRHQGQWCPRGEGGHHPRDKVGRRPGRRAQERSARRSHGQARSPSSQAGVSSRHLRLSAGAVALRVPMAGRPDPQGYSRLAAELSIRARRSPGPAQRRPDPWPSDTTIAAEISGRSRHSALSAPPKAVVV